MKDYKDYSEIEAYIAEARRLRSQAVGEYMVAAWRALARGANALLALAAPKAKAKEHHRRPYLPA